MMMKTRYAQIIAAPPGQKSRELLQRKQAAVADGLYLNFPLFAAHADNALLTDVDGNVFIDFAGGIGVMNVGHAQPQVVSAIKTAAASMTHTCFHVAMYESYVALAEKLNRLVPGTGPQKTFFVNSGAEGIENAAKIARRYTGRPAILAFEHGFHGRTLLAMALTGKVAPYKSGFGPMAGDVYHLPFPYCYRCPQARTGEAGCCMASPEKISELLMTRVAPEQVAAIIFEPVLGEGGFLPFPDGYLEALSVLAEKHGILLIADEIQTGWGRTGKLFAIEHYGLAADITITAKSLGGGLPICSVTGSAEIIDSVHSGGIGSTFGGNPVSCAAANAAVDLIIGENLTQRANEIGERVRHSWTALQQRFDCIGDVRGLGAMNAIEFVRDRQRTPAPELVTSIRQACFEQGLLLLKAGSYGNVIRTLMPLTIELEVLEEGLAIFAEAIARVLTSQVR